MELTSKSSGLARPALGGVLAAVVFYVCILESAGVLGMVGPDEPRYAAIAREMAHTGDWVTPRLHGQPWFEKPVLYYWAAAVSFKMFGVTEAAARLPSALSALIALLAMVFVARRWYGDSSALAFLLIFPSSVAAIGFGRAATTDMPFAACLTVAVAAAAVQLFPAEKEQTRNPWRRGAPLLWGAALGLAVLAKGPAAVVLACGSLGAWALVAGRWKEALRLAHPLAAGAFVTVALPWYVLCAARNPDFFRVFVIEHNFQRFLTPVFRHEQPFWFFGPILLLGLLPWTALLVPLAREGWRAVRSGGWRQSPSVYLACWVVFPVVFFSLSKSKLPGYVLPVIPALTLLLARAATRALNQVNPWPARWLALHGLTFLALAFSAGYWLRRLPEGSVEALGNGGFLPVWILLVGVSGTLMAALAWRGRGWVALALSAVVTAGLVLGIHQRVLPRLDAQLTPRAAARIALRESEARPVRVHQVHRAWHYGLNFYFRRDLPVWLEGQMDGVIITSDAGLLDLLARGYRVRATERPSGRAIVVTISKAPAPETPAAPPPASSPGKS